jgi:beta-galactosidase
MIEIRRRRITIDGTPSMIMAGELHYFRVPRAEWGGRLDLVAEIGCNCVASYIPWLFHELTDGSFDLTGRTRPERDLGAFLDLCAERGLMFFARPGPFVMAELKNEGLPYRLYLDHPEISPVGWDSAPAPTRTVDYLAEAFLLEADRWYAAVMPVLAARLQTVGGPVVGVQLDNEIGMLAWISNAPDLTDALLQDLLGWCRTRYGDRLATRYPVDLESPAGWTAAVRSPNEAWAAALRVDLGWFMRDRFARYVDALAESARRHGVTGVPFVINIHGTQDGNGVPFAIGVSQLFQTYAGREGFTAGSDHYLGEMSPPVTTDIHFINAVMAAINGPDQPLTSCEFEAGTGDYGGGLEQLHDPSTVDLKTRLCLAQGNRMINYYLLAGGINPHLDAAVGDGNDRISFTGEQHGTAAPIGPLGQRGLAFAATAGIAHAVQANSRWLADLDEELDDVTVGFWPDAFMTEYHHPDSPTMTEVVEDLVAYRGPGEHKALWRSLLLAGFRFGASNLQDPGVSLPRTVAFSSGLVLDTAVQQRLVDHLSGGGSLLLVGRLPQRDSENRRCTVLADALGLSPGELVRGTSRHYPSLVGHGATAWMPETRVGWLAELNSAGGEQVFTDVTGRICAVTVDDGPGRAIVATTDLPSHPALFTALLGRLDCEPGLRLRTSVPGVVVTTGVTTRGERMLHVLNPTGYAATVQVDMSDPTGLLDQPLAIPARTGRMLGLGLRLPNGGAIVSSNAEIAELADGRLRFLAGLGDRTEVWLRTDHTVTGADVRTEGELTVVTGPAGADLAIEFG